MQNENTMTTAAVSQNDNQESAASTYNDLERMEDDFAFESLPISPEILRGVSELGFTEMTPIQHEAIPALLSGRDVIGQAQTGTGKTAAFGLPILQKVDPENRNLQAIILCPTRELAMQAADDLRDFAKYMHGVKVLPVYGGQDIQRQIYGLKGTQIVVGTPGRVMDHMRRHTIKMDDISMVILDEADEMLDMGFREDMEVILGTIEQEHQTCLFSATMPQEILNLTKQFQKDPVFIKMTQKELTVDSITQYFYGVQYEYKTVALMRLLSAYRYKRCIIFCNTKACVDELAETLTNAGYAAEGLHGDLNQRQRDLVMGRFRSGQLTILIATDIAARGIDVDDVEAVINYDIPLEAEYYVHRIGRTGRAGKEGVAHSLCRSRDFRKIHEIENIVHVKMEERRIPSVNEIRKAQQEEAMEKVMASLTEGHSGSLIPIIREFCQENDITMEAFAAAALKMQLPEIPDDQIEVGLPVKEEQGRGGRRGRSGERGERRGRRGERGRRFDDRDSHGEHRGRFEDEDRHGNRRGKFEDENGHGNHRGWFEDEDGHGNHRGRFEDEDPHGNRRSRFEEEEGRSEDRDGRDGRRGKSEDGYGRSEDRDGRDGRRGKSEDGYGRSEDRDSRAGRRGKSEDGYGRSEDRDSRAGHRGKSEERSLRHDRHGRSDDRAKGNEHGIRSGLKDDRFAGKKGRRFEERDMKKQAESRTDANTEGMNSAEQKSHRRKQKEQSRRILKQALKDVGRHGEGRRKHGV